MDVQGVPVIDVDDVNVSVSSTTAARLRQYASRVSAEVGFEITLNQAIANLLHRDALSKEHIPLPTIESPAGEKPGTASRWATLVSTPGGALMSLSDKALMDQDIAACMNRGETIFAIKLCRERSKCGLKEAKDYVESDYWKGESS